MAKKTTRRADTAKKSAAAKAGGRREAVKKPSRVRRDGGKAIILTEEVTPNWIWWEKTVEYVYALGQLGGYEQICPLAGSHERAGDVIAKKKMRWWLIEFKRFGPTPSVIKRATQIASEIKKFKGSDAAKTALRDYLIGNDIKFHSIVYGSHTTKEGSLSLGAHDYWHSGQSRVVFELMETTHTCNHTDFTDYLHLFMDAKGGDTGGTDGGNWEDKDAPNNDPSSSGGGKKQPKSKKEAKNIDFLNVLAVDATGEKIFCAPLVSFYSSLDRKKWRAPPNTGGGDGSSPTRSGGPRGKGDGDASATIPRATTPKDAKRPSKQSVRIRTREIETA